MNDLIKNSQDCLDKIEELKKEKIDLGASQKKTVKKRKAEIDTEIKKLKLKHNEFITKENKTLKQIQKDIEKKEQEEAKEIIKKEKAEEIKQIQEASKDNERKIIIQDLFKGDTRTLKHFGDNERFVVYANSNFILEYDIYSKNFDLFFEYETKDGFNKEIFGGFKKARKIKREEINISENVELEKKQLIEIHNVSGNDDTYIKEFDLNTNRWEELGIHVKIGNQRGQYLAIPRKTFSNFLSYTDLILEEKEEIVDCYGIFSKKYQLLPNKYELKASIQKNAEIKAFERLIKTPICDNKELKEIGTKLKEYLEKSRATQLSFFYSLSGVYRYYLMDKGLKEFPFFALKSSIGDRGKSTRLKIVNNLFLAGYNSEGLTQSELKGTGVRLNSYQYLNIALLIDDASAFSNETIIGLFKTLATSKYIEQQKGRPTGEMIKYRVLRPIMCSFNRLLIPDVNLVRRFIIIDLDDQLVNDFEKQPKEDLILYLENNIADLGNYFWNNQDLFFPLLENIETKRADAKETILELGFNICNKLFENLGIGKLSKFDFKQYITDAKQYISTSEDDFKTEFKSQIQRLTTTRVKITDDSSKSVDTEDYNIFDFIGENYEWEKKEKVLNKAHNKGIYLYKDNILITRKALEFFNFKGIKLKTTTSLKEYFDESEYELKTGDAGGVNPEGNFGTKKGFLLKLDYLSDEGNKSYTQEDMKKMTYEVA